MTRPANPTVARDAGFSLIEVLAALTILAIGAALLVPKLGGGRNALAVQVAALELVAALKATRAASMSSGKPLSFVLDAATRTYFAEGAIAPRPIPSAVAMTFQLRSAAGVRGSYAVIRFYPDGSASGGEIELRSGATKAGVLVDWLTGRSSMSAAGKI